MVISVQEVKRKFSIWEYKCFVHDQFLTDFLRNGPLFIVHLKKKKNQREKLKLFFAEYIQRCDEVWWVTEARKMPIFPLLLKLLQHRVW